MYLMFDRKDFHAPHGRWETSEGAQQCLDASAFSKERGMEVLSEEEVDAIFEAKNAEWCGEAMLLQDACNFGAVLRTTSRAADFARSYCNWLYSRGKPAPFEYHSHPAVILLMDKLHDLMGRRLDDTMAFSNAWDACKEAVEKAEAQKTEVPA